MSPESHPRPLVDPRSGGPRRRTGARCQVSQPGEFATWLSLSLGALSLTLVAAVVTAMSVS